MSAAGSLIVYCHQCGTPHLASAMRRERGVWWLLCRVCGKVAWKARL